MSFVHDRSVSDIYYAFEKKSLKRIWKVKQFVNLKFIQFLCALTVTLVMFCIICFLLNVLCKLKLQSDKITVELPRKIYSFSKSSRVFYDKWNWFIREASILFETDPISESSRLYFVRQHKSIYEFPANWKFS